MIIKQIKFIIKNIIRIILNICLSIIPRCDNMIVMGSRIPKTKFQQKEKDIFLHSTKILFLYLSSQKTDWKFIYICDDKNMINIFHKNGYKNVYSRKSIKGFLYMLRAKYWLYNNDREIDISSLSGGAKCINLWHGVSWKKFAQDQANIIEKLNRFSKKIYLLLTNIREDYVVANNDLEVKCFQTALLAEPENTPILGSPRYDMFFKDIEHVDLFMEEDYKNIKAFKEQGKKLFLYMPTFRDTGKDISAWLKSEELKLFLKNNNAILICKLHFADKNSLDFPLDDCFYKMDKNADAYAVFKYTDAIISDYSSAIIDYMLIDKPAIYYVPDLEEYQKVCRGFYVPYDEWVAGEKAYNFQELLSAMQNSVDNPSKYSEERRIFRDKFFRYQDGNNCERVLKWIKTL